MESEGSLPSLYSSSVHTFLSYFFKNNFSIILPSISRSSQGVLFFRVSYKCCMLPGLSHVWYTLCTSHPPWLDKESKLWSSSLCSSFDPPIISLLLGPNISLSAVSTCSFLYFRDQVSHHTKILSWSYYCYCYCYYYYYYYYYYYGSTALCLALAPFFSLLILYRVSRTPWTGDRPVARPLPIHRTTQTQNKHTIHTSMPWVGLEATIPAFEGAKTVHALDRSTTVIGTELK
jgi:hypothetical protein